MAKAALVVHIFFLLLRYLFYLFSSLSLVYCSPSLSPLPFPLLINLQVNEKFVWWEGPFAMMLNFGEVTPDDGGRAMPHFHFYFEKSQYIRALQKLSYQPFSLLPFYFIRFFNFVCLFVCLFICYFLISQRKRYHAVYSEVPYAMKEFKNLLRVSAKNSAVSLLLSLSLSFLPLPFLPLPSLLL